MTGSADIDNTDWHSVPVSEAAEVNPTAVLPPNEFDHLQVPLYEMGEIDESIGRLRVPSHVPLHVGRSGKTKFWNGDVLFSKITPCVQNGKCALASGIKGDVAFGSSEFYVLRANRSVLPEYLFYFLRQQAVIESAIASFTGTSGRQRVPRTFWDTLQIPLAPLIVQERIVEILQKADEIRGKRSAALDIAENLLPTLFLDNFGDPASNPRNHAKLTIGEVTTMVTSGYTPKGGANNYVPTGPLLLRSQNIQMLSFDLYDCAHLPANIFEEMDRVHVMPGDVLMNITGKGTAGRVTWVEDELQAAVNQHVCIIRCDQRKVLAPFLAITLSMPHYQEIIDRAPGSGQTGFNHQSVRALEVIIPPLPVQSSFVSQVGVANEIVRKYKDAVKDAENAFASLMSKAFTGELTAEWETENAEQIARRQVFYERLPRLLLVALLAEKANRANSASAEVLVTALMKYVFLFQMEGNGRRRFYNFIPYHYGPFAKELYDELETLQDEGLVSIENDREEDKTRINLVDSDRVEDALTEFPDDLKEDVASIIDHYGDLDHGSLLNTVYGKYPAYAKKSRLRRARRS